MVESPQGVLDALVEQSVATAASAWVGTSRGVLWSGVAGRTRSGRGGALVRADTRFDLASLTKPFSATLARVLAQSKAMALALRVGDVWPDSHPTMARATMEHLLRHRSSLQAWTPLQLRCAKPGDVPNLLTGGALLGGSRPTYSDLGYILWSSSVESVLGVSFEAALRTSVLSPLGLERIQPSPGAVRDVAETILDGRREHELAAAQKLDLPVRRAPSPGAVQDGNARFLGGLAGHAGLFGDAESVATLGREWLRPRRLLRPRDVAASIAGPQGAYALGWARRRVAGSAGPALSAGAFGHTGSTGTSLWIDPEADLVAVLLAHRTSASSDFNHWRRAFHRSARALAGSRA
ncbi:MAG: serine hydrolase domain-containing protein [Acidobacteriota bacterium]